MTEQGWKAMLEGTSKDGLVQDFPGKAALESSSAALSSCILKAFFEGGLTMRRLFQCKVAAERNS